MWGPLITPAITGRALPAVWVPVLHDMLRTEAWCAISIVQSNLMVIIKLQGIWYCIAMKETLTKHSCKITKGQGISLAIYNAQYNNLKSIQVTSNGLRVSVDIEDRKNSQAKSILTNIFFVAGIIAGFVMLTVTKLVLGQGSTGNIIFDNLWPFIIGIITFVAISHLPDLFKTNQRLSHGQNLLIPVANIKEITPKEFNNHHVLEIQFDSEMNSQQISTIELLADKANLQEYKLIMKFESQLLDLKT